MSMTESAEPTRGTAAPTFDTTVVEVRGGRLQSFGYESGPHGPHFKSDHLFDPNEFEVIGPAKIDLEVLRDGKVSKGYIQIESNGKATLFGLTEIIPGNSRRAFFGFMPNQFKPADRIKIICNAGLLS